MIVFPALHRLVRAPGFMCLLLAITLFGQALPLNVRAQEGSADSLCVVLALDASGSMESNDAGGMRFTAARLFVALLDAGDRVGLVQFSSGSHALTDGLVTIGGPVDKTALIERLAPTPPGGYTDVKAGLTEAATMLSGAQGCGARTVVLLTDGKPEIEAHYAAYEDEALDVARQLGVPVMSIALTAAGESPFLLRLADVTDPPGAVLPAADASTLLDAYLDVLSRLKDRTLAGSGSAQAPADVTLPLDPALAPYVEQASFVVSTPPGVTPTLIAPGGTPLTPDAPGVSFSQTDVRFAVYTVVAPVGGDWAFRLEGAGQDFGELSRAVQARAVLRSRLRVSPVGPGPFHPLGQPLPIVANLIEQAADGVPTTLIGEAAFSALIQRPDGSREALDLLYDDGTHGDARASDGDFTGLYVNTDIPGLYEVTLRGRKGVIPVTGRLRVSVVPFPVLTVELPEAGLHQVRDEPLALSVVLSGAETSVLDQGQLVAQVTTPDGRTDEVALTAEDEGTRYSGSYRPLSDGDYRVRFVPVGAWYKGVAYEAEALRTFSAVLVPTITILDEAIELGTVEGAQLASGLSTELRLSSTSGGSEPVSVSLAGVPGLNLAGVQPTSLAPAGETTLLLTVQSADLAPGAYEATLVVAVRDGVDIARREILLRLSVYLPTLTLSETDLDLGAIRADRLDQVQHVRFVVDSTSLQDEDLELVVEAEWDDFGAEWSPHVAPAGERTEVEVTLALPQGLGRGDYQAALRLLARDEVALTPGTVEVRWSVEPVPWTARYGLPLALGGVLLLAALVAFGVWSARIQRPWGVLLSRRVPPGALELDYRLHQSDWRGRVFVGGQKGSQVELAHPSIRPRHAVILVETQTVTEPVGRPPRPLTVTKPVCLVRNLGDGLVQVGGARLLAGQSSPPLKRGTRIKFGEFEFEWREA
ncbi:MAG: VWA domain-containing protein [Anaerolineae bacterium]